MKETKTEKKLKGLGAKSPILPSEQKATIANLRATLWQQIEGQEIIEHLYRKILKRLSYIAASLSLAVFVGISFVIFTVSRPNSVLYQTLQAKKDLDTINSIQFRIIKINTGTMLKNSIKIDSLEKELSELKKNK